MAVTEGDIVAVEYTGRLESGEQFDTSEGRDPLRFQVGAKQVVPGFEKGVLGMAVGDEKRVTIPPADGYGERDERLVRGVPRADIQVEELKEGHILALQSQEGHSFYGTVTDIGEEEVKLDFNHRLAGQTLIFDIKVVAVSDAADEPASSAE